MKTLLFALSLIASLASYAQADNGKVCTVAEKMPQYPGGEEAMVKFITEHIEYPAKERDSYVEGRVVVGFVVDEEGQLTDIAIKKSVSKGLDAEALRIVRIMPDFVPGMDHGQKVKVSYVLPILFRLKVDGAPDSLAIYRTMKDGRPAYLKGMRHQALGEFGPARAYFEIGAEKHSVDAIFEMGVVFEYGWGAFRDYEKALTYYNVAADSGSLQALVERGVMYENGWGVAEDKVKAAQDYRRAAEQGDKFGQLNLGLFYRWGKGGLAQNDTTAVYWYRKSADQGFNRAQCEMGLAYEHGRGGLHIDTTEALRWYDLAAAQHYGVAQNNYAWLSYARGKVTDKALAYSQESLLPDSSNIDHLDTYAALLSATGRNEEAEAIQRRALDVGADTIPDYLEHYGDILMKLKRKDKAREYWQRALEMPDHSAGLADKLAMRNPKSK